MCVLVRRSTSLQKSSNTYTYKYHVNMFFYVTYYIYINSIHIFKKKTYIYVHSFHINIVLPFLSNVDITFSEDKSFIEVASPLLENFAHACAAPGALEKDDSCFLLFSKSSELRNGRKSDMNPMNIQYFSKQKCRSLLCITCNVQCIYWNDRTWFEKVYSKEV